MALKKKLLLKRLLLKLRWKCLLLKHLLLKLRWKLLRWKPLRWKLLRWKLLRLNPHPHSNSRLHEKPAFGPVFLRLRYVHGRKSGFMRSTAAANWSSGWV